MTLNQYKQWKKARKKRDNDFMLTNVKVGDKFKIVEHNEYSIGFESRIIELISKHNSNAPLFRSTKNDKALYVDWWRLKPYVAKEEDLSGKTVLLKSLKKLKKGPKKRTLGLTINNNGAMDHLAGTVVQLGYNKTDTNACKMKDQRWLISNWMVEAIIDEEEVNKSLLDWRDAFTDTNAIKVNYSCADTIQIKEAYNCKIYTALCAYVSQFECGGFWYSKNGLYFTTASPDSDPLATYEHAKAFVDNFN